MSTITGTYRYLDAYLYSHSDSGWSMLIYKYLPVGTRYPAPTRYYLDISTLLLGYQKPVAKSGAGSRLPILKTLHDATTSLDLDN